MTTTINTQTGAKPVTGQPINRVDGRPKVMGEAHYAAEFPLDNIAHAVIIQSAIAKGRIQNIDVSAVENAPGVLTVITHHNAPRLNEIRPDSGVMGKPGEKKLPLQSDEVDYDGQHIGVVVAETFEQAKYAASLVRVTYEEQNPTISIEQGKSSQYQPKDFFGEEVQARRGDTESALASAEVKIEAIYTTPIEHHNPMEPPASIAMWEGNSLIIYDATQWVYGARDVIAYTLGIHKETVRIISHYVGGGFGCKGFTWWHPLLAAIASRKVGRPVKLVLTRQQMFTSCGHRPRTIQEIAFGAKQNGQLTAIRHITTSETSFVDEHVEPCGMATRILYASPNLEV